MSTSKWSISPNFDNTKLASGRIEDKIEVFEDQMRGWMLLHAKGLCSNQYQFRHQAGFAVLTIVATYFEPIESYYAGRQSHGSSKEFFRRGFLRVFAGFPDTLKNAGYSSPDELAQQIADEIYDQLRCGLFHEGTTKHKLLIRQGTAPLGFMLKLSTGGVGSIVIDPCRFLEAVEAHLDNYVARLRSPSEDQLRTNFETFFDYKLSRPGPVLPPLVQSGP